MAAGDQAAVVESVGAIVDKYRGVAGALLPILHEVQGEFGYISPAAVEVIARFLRLSPAQVYAVVTFYPQFRTHPQGRNVIALCGGTACRIRGALRIRRVIEAQLDVEAGETTPDGEFTFETTACLGACGMAPVVVINDEIIGRQTPATIRHLLRTRRY